MRLVALLAGAAFIAVLSLVAAPGSAGSRSPSRPAGVDPALLQPLLVRDLAVQRDGRMPLPFGSPVPGAAATDQGWATTTSSGATPGVLSTAGPSTDAGPSSAAWGAEGTATDSGSLSVLSGRLATEVADALSASRGVPTSSTVRRTSIQPTSVPRSLVVLHGIASWYDNGTTAMRWARGTRVRICGPAACVNRVVTDWGPDFRIYPDRVVDLMPSDFARVCGCSPRIGLTEVTVEIVG